MSAMPVPWNGIYGPAEEGEFHLEWFCEEQERVRLSPPPAPEGLQLVECIAEPRHWPMYLAHVDGQYPGPCLFCQVDDCSQRERIAKCRAEHRRWKSWNIWSRIAGRLYVLGVTSSGGGTSFGRCEFCGIGRQHMAPRWRGRRSYILGVKRETWGCLFRGHRRTEHLGCGLCTICAPCSECGSTDVAHSDGIDCEVTP
jgi:hypothetical protein